MRSKGPVVVVDGGGSFAPRVIQEAERAQRIEKAALIAEAFSMAGIDALAIAPTDWALGRSTITALAAEHDLPVLAANLTCEGVQPFPASKVIERGGMRVGIVGLTTGTVPGCEVADPQTAARAARDSLGEVDVAVLLAPLDTRGFDGWPPVGYDLLVTTSGRMHDSAAPLLGGWELSSGSRGKQLGIATLQRVPGAFLWEPVDAKEALEKRADDIGKRIDAARKRIEAAATDSERHTGERQLARNGEELEKILAQIDELPSSHGPTHRLEVQLEELSSEVADHAATRAKVDEALIRIAALQPAPVELGPRRVDAGPFAGSDRCASCHSAQHEQWAGTGHAHAWASLVGMNRASDLECFSCHVTGRGQDGGPADPAGAAAFRDVQCEACHGPAREHATDPAAQKPVREPAVETCRGCHDGDRDAGQFDPATYVPKVSH